jgi:hypothetical protein
MSIRFKIMTKLNGLSSGDKIYHRLSASEIKYGILTLRSDDNSRRFFYELPRTFTLYIKGHILYNRRVSADKIWISFDIMSKFRLGEVLKLWQRNNIVYTE